MSYAFTQLFIRFKYGDLESDHVHRNRLNTAALYMMVKTTEKMKNDLIDGYTAVATIAAHTASLCNMDSKR